MLLEIVDSALISVCNIGGRELTKTIETSTLHDLHVILFRFSLRLLCLSTFLR